MTAAAPEPAAATAGQADEPFTMDEFDAEVRRRWIESSDRLGLDHGMPNTAAALAAQRQQDARPPQETAGTGAGQAARDLRAELVHAEFTGWAEAQSYDESFEFNLEDMAEAFTAGMDAQADLAVPLIAIAAQQPQAAPGGKRDPLSCPCCVFRGDDCWCPTDCGAKRCQAREVDDEQPAAELAAAMAEARQLRELVTEILRTFGDSSGDGWRSRAGQVKYHQWRKRAGLAS